MKSSAFYAVIGIGALAVACIVLLSAYGYVPASHTIPSASSATVNASSTPSLTGLAIYTNGQYGFSVFYPATSTATTTFPTTQYMPLIEIEGLRIEVSSDAKVVAMCEKPASSEEVQSPSKAVFGGATWYLFSEQGITSYRTVHDGACFVIEEASSSPALSTVAHTFSFVRS